MRFKGLDLNLLVAFDALLAERSVSRAADRLNLSQPAMSNALTRLRRFFADDLLVASGKRMYPTPLAEALGPQVRAALGTMEGLIAASRHFDPATSARSFRIMASDYIATAVLFPLIARLAVEAPNVRIDLLLPSERRFELIESGGIDLLITLEPYLTPEMPSDPLLEDEYVVVGRAGHPALAGPLSTEAMLAYPHILVAIGEGRLPSFGDAYLERLGLGRRVAAVAPSFTPLPWLLIETDWLTLIQRRLATLLAARFDLAVAPPPVAIPPLVEMAQYHLTRRSDPGLRWLIERIRAAG